MRKQILVVAVCAALGACAQAGPIQDQAVKVIADTSDALRNDAELVLCRGITVGAWVRAYGDSVERAAAWRTLCSSSPKALPAP